MDLRCDDEFPIATGTAAIVRDAAMGNLLYINGVPVSQIGNDPLVLDFEYMNHFSVLLEAFVARSDHTRLRVVHLGAAGCTMARWIHARWPFARQLAVDIDPVLVNQARTWHNLPRSPALRLRAGDAREVLSSRRPASAEVIIRDVFATDITPPHLVTSEFAAQAAQVLTRSGLYLANCEDRPPLRHIRREVASTSAAFRHVMLIAEPGQFKHRRHGNFVIAASQAPLFDVERELRALPTRATSYQGERLVHFAGQARPFSDQDPCSCTSSVN